MRTAHHEKINYIEFPAKDSLCLSDRCELV